MGNELLITEMDRGLHFLVSHWEANEQEMESVTDALASIAGRANLNFVVLKRAY